MRRVTSPVLPVVEQELESDYFIVANVMNNEFCVEGLHLLLVRMFV